MQIGMAFGGGLQGVCIAPRDRDLTPSTAREFWGGGALKERGAHEAIPTLKLPPLAVRVDIPHAREPTGVERGEGAGEGALVVGLHLTRRSIPKPHSARAP